MLTIRKSLIWVAAGLFVLALGASPASADVLTFNFTSDHCTGGCLTGQTSAATLTLTGANSGTGGVDVLITMLNNNKIVNTGLNGSFDWNLAGNPIVTVSGPFIVPAASLPQAFDTVPTSGGTTGAGTLHFDGLGDFEYGIEWGVSGGGNGFPNSTLSFHISNINLTSFEGNAGGQFFGLDILSGTTGNTGAVDVTPGTPVPEPGTLLLLGSGLVGMGAFGWRRHRR